jgi:hypothetical protein
MLRAELPEPPWSYSDHKNLNKVKALNTCLLDTLESSRQDLNHDFNCDSKLLATVILAEDLDACGYNSRDVGRDSDNADSRTAK